MKPDMLYWKSKVLYRKVEKFFLPKMITKTRKGFTLIEILIVVAIIAILASVVLIGLGPTQQAGRDARRLSDLHQVQNGLELYYNRCGFYPGPAQPAAGACDVYAAAASWAAMTTSLTTLKGGGASPFGILTVPKDPVSGKTYYYAQTATGQSYIVGALLDNTNNQVFNGYTAPATALYTNGTLPPNKCVAPDFCLAL